MKGIEDVNAVLFMVAIILGLLFTLSLLSVKLWVDKDIGQAASLKEDKYIMHYALESAKLYADTSLKYSLYQSCYDMLKNGGNNLPKNEKTFDSRKYSVIASREEFSGNIKTSVLNNFRRYTAEGYNFLTYYTVGFPQYEIKEISYGTGEINIIADSDKKLQIPYQRETRYFSEEVVLEKAALLTVPVKTNCFEIYSFGLNKRTGLENDIRVLVESKFKDKNGNVFSAEYTLQYSGPEPDCETVFKENTGENYGEVRNRVKTILLAQTEKLGKAESNFEIKTSLLEFDLKVDGVMKDVQVLPDGTTTKTCTFKYTKITDASVFVGDKNGKNIPVWNGAETVFESMTMVFYIEVIS